MTFNEINNQRNWRATVGCCIRVVTTPSMTIRKRPYQVLHHQFVASALAERRGASTRTCGSAACWRVSRPTLYSCKPEMSCSPRSRCASATSTDVQLRGYYPENYVLNEWERRGFNIRIEDGDAQEILRRTCA